MTTIQIKKTIRKIIQLKTVQCVAGFLLLSLQGIAHAQLCPNNFNDINKGDSKDLVEKQCGKPVKVNQSEKEPGVPQEWVYYMSPPRSNINTPQQQQQPNIKTTMAFDQDGKLINISVDGFGMKDTKLCGGHALQISDSIEKVKAACGSPTMLNKQETDVQTGQPRPKVKVEEWIYNDAFGTEFLFENDKFVGVKN